MTCRSSVAENACASCQKGTLLVTQGRLDKSTLIPCNIRSGDDSDTEISLAENTQREAMHIVDEILAYRQLVEGGMTPENIAARFGQSVATVRQRLKLASLSPKILGELREDKIRIDQAKALAISDDHAAQDRAWFETQSWNRDPYSLRAMLTRDHVRSTDKLALFVGIEAYEAAGGQPCVICLQGIVKLTSAKQKRDARHVHCSCASDLRP